VVSAEENFINDFSKEPRGSYCGIGQNSTIRHGTIWVYGLPNGVSFLEEMIIRNFYRRELS
jgi:hypothetical protein